jgi:UDP-N-acetylglucosamine--N-acetylmuramyl-(pentapeptide) pyrophosphoryl-undecaprenol N-acetylglucosamine transferase
VIWQTGKLYFERYKKYAAKSNLKVVQYINKMDFALAAADIIISRAGAVAASELAIVGKPTIFIPSPNVAENHQTKNAQAFETKNAAVLLPEKNMNEKFPEILKQLISDEKYTTELSENMKKMARPNATRDIANEVESLIQHQNR